MAISRKKQYTPAEYLKLEVSSDIRHEFLDGEIFAMSGSTVAHNEICGNLTFAIQSAIRSRKLPCHVYANDLRLRIKKANMYAYPDVMLICGKLEFDAARKDVVLNPTTIFEVLSDSTANYDRTLKFAAYRQIPSLQEYVMVDQARTYVEVFRRDKSKFWVLEALENARGTLRLESIDVQIPLAAIYEGVEVEGE
jgi:Uma2 family endonuclease